MDNVYDIGELYRFYDETDGFTELFVVCDVLESDETVVYLLKSAKIIKFLGRNYEKAGFLITKLT